MFWKVNYEKDSQKDCLYYGGATTNEQKNMRNKKLKENGFKILNCYKVKTMQ